MKNNILAIFYSFAFTITLAAGFTLGLSDSHTPPAAFILGSLFTLIGIIWLIADSIQMSINKKSGKSIVVHIVGIVANSAIPIYILYLAIPYL